ncbi:protein disulfide-isomerase A4 [Yasminevirus sp. GU-2018]|uniref:Protein disulfide-isomerase A4 n=1 Tax=Yasminevirus sp. GU-2018 TaxID=2420051 RepID=A0A5K0UAN7_9VIRU|nr:protein disulfide-isomerase A4 [Yasminevirus sp. GU-2018]
MPGKPIKLTLFHAEWCGHCHNFMPTWENMSTNKDACKNIEFKAYEEQSIADLDEDVRVVDGTDVRSFGYPTLKITVNDRSFVYNGRRTPEEIYRSIIEVIKETGSVDAVVTKTKDGVKVSTSEQDVSEGSREASEQEIAEDALNQLSEQLDAMTDKRISDRLSGKRMSGGGKPLTSSMKKPVRRLNDNDFKFLDIQTNFSEVAKIK